MPLKDYEESKRLVEEHFALSDFKGPCDVELIDKSEKTLEIQLPLTFRLFIADFGVDAFGAEEFYGINKDNFLEESHRNIVLANIRDRESYGHEKYLILFYAVGDGTYLALDTSRMVNNECPVVRCYCGPCSQSNKLKVCAQDFGEMFLNLTTEEIEYIERDEQDDDED